MAKFVGRATSASVFALALGAAFAVPFCANAQAAAPAQSAPAAAADTTDTGGLQDIVVTAQRRAENLQRVPIAVTAITGNAAQAAGITSTQDLTSAVPGLIVQTQAASVQMYMRGVGTDATQAGTENAVATFIDGVYVPSMNALFFSFDNVERLEVLKGPQGTLYGRNAVAGVINVISKDPSSDPHFEGSVGYGNLKDFQANAYASGALAQGVNLGIAGVYNDQAKGAGINVATGHEVNKDKDAGLNAQLVLEPNDRLKIKLSGFYDHHEGSYGLAYRNAGNGSRSADGATSFPYGFYDVNSNVDPRSKGNFYMGAAHIDYDLDFATLTSITAYQRVNKRFSYDNDGSPVSVVDVNFSQFDRTVSQELRLASSPSAGKLTWVLGGYFYRDRTGYNPFGLSGGGLGGLVLAKDATQVTRSLAVFGQATYEFLPETRLTVGGRYTSDHRTLYAADNSNVGLVDPVLHQKNTSNAPTWRLALDHRFDDGTLVYASYSRGFKSGEFNLAAFPSTGTTIVKPEKLDDYEAGVKTELFDNHVRLNAAGFYYNYRNMQFSAYNGTTDELINAASSHIYGLDLDVLVAPTHDLTFSGGVEYLHARFSSFPNAPILTNPELGNISNPGSATGNDLLKAPHFVANAGIDYKYRMASGSAIETNVNYYYNDGFYWAPDNRVRQPHYQLVNASVAWVAPNNRYRVTFWGKNLFAEHYFTQLTEQNGLGDTGVAAAPRTYGVRLGVSF